MKAYTERVFGNVEGQDVLAYRFETDGGYQLEVMTYGATILRYVTPDKAGNFANVILGFDDFDSYVGNSPKHGASVGPVAGRIAGATFELNGKIYDLEVNNASNCNHSGSTGWDSSLFELVEGERPWLDPLYRAYRWDRRISWEPQDLDQLSLGRNWCL